MLMFGVPVLGAVIPGFRALRMLIFAELRNLSVRFFS
jgi:hypothetical protein